MKKYLIIFFLMFYTIANAQIISTIVGNGTNGFAGDGGQATNCKLNNPYGIGVDSLANIYVCDAHNNRIRKVATTGIITTIAGTGTAGYTGDLGPATDAELDWPYGIHVNPGGVVYVSDYNNHVVREIKSGIIRTIAGNGTYGYTGDGGPATNAELSSSEGIFWDESGDVYFADHYNNVIRKISSAGIITTVAGTGTAGYSGDGGPATAAKLNEPVGVARDPAGNMYIVDMYNFVVRKVNSAGIISTIAGNGTMGSGGDGGPATNGQFTYPIGIFLDPSGNIYIGDADNQRVRKISTTGILSTVAGTGVSGYCCDGGPATSAKLSEPQGVFVDKHYNIYIGDCLNNRIRKISCDLPPLAPIIGATSFCLGTTISLTDSSIGGVWSSSNSYATISSTGIVTGLLAGIDTIAYSFSNICSEPSATHIITIDSTPNAGIVISTGTDTFCTGIPIDLNDVASGGVWSSVNTLLATINDTGLATGLSAGIDTIKYTVTNSCGTAIASYPLYLKICPVGISETMREILQSELIIYPNPSKSLVTINLPLVVKDKWSILKITNVLGSVIQSKIIEPGNTSDLTFDIKNISPGTYFLNVVCGAMTYSGKLIIQN